MKKLDRHIISSCIFLFCFFILSGNAFATTLTGIVYDHQRNTLPDVDIELEGNTGAFRNHVRTDSTGKYQISGLGEGYFTVRVLPFRYDYEEQSQTIYIQTVSLTGGQTNDTIIQDFYLAPRKGSLIDYETKVVFVQDIPLEAKKSYELAIVSFSKKRNDEAVSALKDAVAKFPSYFQALFQLGKVYFFKGEYGTASQYLIKAGDINNKSAMSFFLLGDALRRLGYNKAAIVALNQAHTLIPASSQVLLSLGTAQRQEGVYLEAEKNLKQAEKLSRISNPEIHWQLAQLYGQNLKKYDQAANELEAFLKARPDAKDTEKIKKLIKDFREKAKSSSS
jgi:tetratricopeptide (TPR) repeat protein